MSIGSTIMRQAIEPAGTRFFAISSTRAQPSANSSGAMAHPTSSCGTLPVSSFDTQPPDVVASSSGVAHEQSFLAV